MDTLILLVKVMYKNLTSDTFLSDHFPVLNVRMFLTTFFFFCNINHKKCLNIYQWDNGCINYFISKRYYSLKMRWICIYWLGRKLITHRIKKRDFRKIWNGTAVMFYKTLRAYLPPTFSTTYNFSKCCSHIIHVSSFIQKA